MPTGYTAFIEDGDITTGKEFLLLCLRNFGIAIDVRDEPLTVPTPTHFKPCVYAQNRYIAAIEHLKEVKNISFDVAKQQMTKEHRETPFDDSDQAVQQYIQKQIEFCEDDVSRAQEAWDEEIKRTNQKNEFMQLFLESLKNLPGEAGHEVH